ncbi:MAG: tetratricopeptide repeat protein [Bacteroidota bacterium]
MTLMRCVCFIGVLFLVSSCVQTPETVKEQPAEAETKEILFKRGHRLYLAQQFDSALTMHAKAVALDSAYLDPWKDMAEIHYTLALMEGGDKNPRKTQKSREARDCYMRAERLGFKNSDVYERICELSVLMEDDKTFLAYAKKNAEQYPYDRQYFNLGLAYFNAGEYQQVISSQKEAIQKFTSSSFIGSFHRQLGRAYENIDRDQTAEKTFAAGVKAVDDHMALMKKAGKTVASVDAARLQDDKTAMLLALKRLHQRYKADDKLRDVERQLKAAGHGK